MVLQSACKITEKYPRHTSKITQPPHTSTEIITNVSYKENTKIQNARDKLLHNIINIFVENETINCTLFYFCQ